MVSPEMVEAAARADASYAGRTFDALASSDKVRFTERAKFMLEAALSTYAEPVAWRSRHSAQENWYYSDGARSWWECQPLYAAPTVAEPVKTAPAVAVKGLEWFSQRQYILSDTPFGTYRILGDIWWFENGGRNRVKSFEEAKAAAEADYEARILAALSAQVQDVEAPEGFELYGHWSKHRLSDGCFLPLPCSVPEGPDYTTIALYRSSPASKHGGP